MNNATSIQQAFLQRIKDLTPPNVSFVNELADLLEISVDSAYRRIRGETALTLDETIKVCGQYRISLESIASSPSGSVTFQYQQMEAQQKFQVYLENIYGNLQKVKATNGGLIYAADDVPIFHHFKHKEHAAFKMFYWMRSVLNIPEFVSKKFSVAQIPEEFIALGKNIYQAYLQVDAAEIWTEESATSTLKQIAYYWESGLFEYKEEAILACEQLGEILQTIQQQAARKHKHENDQFDLYASEIQVGNNCVLVKIGEMKLTYLRHQTFNTMITQNASFCNETEAFLNNLMQKSILLSGVSEKQRHRFFQYILQKTENLLAKIKAE